MKKIHTLPRMCGRLIQSESSCDKCRIWQHERNGEVTSLPYLLQGDQKWKKTLTCISKYVHLYDIISMRLDNLIWFVYMVMDRYQILCDLLATHDVGWSFEKNVGIAIMKMMRAKFCAVTYTICKNAWPPLIFILFAWKSMNVNKFFSL